MSARICRDFRAIPKRSTDMRSHVDRGGSAARVLLTLVTPDLEVKAPLYRKTPDDKLEARKDSVAMVNDRGGVGVPGVAERDATGSDHLRAAVACHWPLSCRVS
jgi:hypothetical protein